MAGRLRVPVVDPDPVQEHRMARGQHLGDGSAQPAQDGVVLDRDDPAGAARDLHDRLLVERLEGGYVDDDRIEAARDEPWQRRQNARGLQPRGEDGRVASFTDDDRARRVEAVRAVKQQRRGAPRKADVYGSGELEGPAQHGAGLVLVARGHHGHSGHRAHRGDVVDALVGLAGQPGQDARRLSQDPPRMLLLRHRLDHTRKQHLTHTQRQKEEDRPDLVEAAVDASRMTAQVVLREDDVLVVEDLDADDPGRRGQ